MALTRTRQLPIVMGVLKCKPVASGEWVQPRRRAYLLQCCDCGLIHRMNFRVLKNGRGAFIQFQAFRATPQDIRKHRQMVSTVAKLLAPVEIALLRKKLQKTQAQFAEMLAVDPVTISRWENGMRRPRPVYARELERLANG